MEIDGTRTINGFIYTLSDQLLHIEEILEKFPNLAIHVGAPSICSQKLKLLTSHPNFYLYEKCKEKEDLEFLLERTDVYLDINIGTEVHDILSIVRSKNIPIYAFEENHHLRNKEEGNLVLDLDQMIHLIKTEVEQDLFSEVVSVVIPVYNAEAYLRRCLDNLLQQTYSKLEVLLVNDASTDHSLEICKEYATEYDSIRLLSTSHHTGVANARNFGIANASGTYILFLDSDDWLDPGFIQDHVEMVRKYDADVSIAPYYSFVEESGVFRGYRSFYQSGMITQDDCLKEMFSNDIIWFSSIIGKLYKRDLFDASIPIRFAYDGSTGDLLMLYQLLSSTSKLIYIDIPSYCKVERNSSFARGIVAVKKVEDSLRVYEEMLMSRLLSGQPLEEFLARYRSLLEQWKGSLELDSPHSSIYQAIKTRLKWLERR